MRLSDVAGAFAMGETDGDAELTAFCRRLHPRLAGALGLHVGDGRLGEELAQETLARVWERWATVRAADSPDAWAFRVGFNLANSRLRRRAAERRAYERAGTRIERSSATDAADVIAVRDAVAALPPRQRAVLVLRYFADMSVDDTALAMKCAPGTVKSLTSRAIGGLRARLGDTVGDGAEGVIDARPA
jgi:RNA polymerase sigma-70 factor (sigma-E family)